MSDERFAVPVTVPQLCTKRVLTAELIHGLPLDQCQHLSQTVRNYVSMKLCCSYLCTALMVHCSGCVY